MANTPVIISRTVIQREGASSASNIVFEGPLNPVNGGGNFLGIGIRLNGKVIGGVKRFIELTDFLEIPSYWDYNIYTLRVMGIIRIEAQGAIYIMDTQRNILT